MITFVIFALAAVCAVEAVLGLALLVWAVVEVSAFLRRHPGGAAGGVRELATGARRIWPLLPGLAKASSQTAGRRVLRSRSGRWVLRRVGRGSAGGASASAVARARRAAPGSPGRRTGGPAPGRLRPARRERLRG